MVHIARQPTTGLLSIAAALVLTVALTLDAAAQGWFNRSSPRNGGAEAAIAELSSRIGILEETVRQLTGEVERLRYLNQPGGPPAQSGPAEVGPARGSNAIVRPATTAPVAAPVANQGGPTSLLPQFSANQAPSRQAPAGQNLAANAPVGGALQLGAPPRPLGTLSGSALRGLQDPLQNPVAGPAPLPQGAAPAPVTRPGVEVATLSAEDEYTAAYAYILQQDFAGAEQAFGDFLTRHPRHELAGNAQYWFGETFYARGGYRRAAQAFLTGYQTYRNSPKAPDSLLKLGMTLAALGETGQACASFDEIAQKFPGASPAVRERAVVERDRVGC